MRKRMQKHKYSKKFRGGMKRKIESMELGNITPEKKKF